MICEFARGLKNLQVLCFSASASASDSSVVCAFAFDSGFVFAFAFGSGFVFAFGFAFASALVPRAWRWEGLAANDNKS